MRIAFVHSFYSSRQPSGENFAVEAEVNVLLKAGYQVELLAARTDELEGDLLHPVRAAWRVATGRGRNPLEAIRSFDPDVVHIHNLFPNFGRRWVEDLDVPVVHTLHNYRPLCANGLLFRDGHICTDCPDGRRWSGVRHACYRDSRVATLPIAWANRKGPTADPLMRRADRLIVLSERQRRAYIAAGVESESLVIWPNFLPDDLILPATDPRDREGWLFVGRLTEEKGILPLVERWPREHRLTIVGEGNQRQKIEGLIRGKTIDLAGSISRKEVLGLMSKSKALIFPSLCYENFPIVYLEAISAGLPVLAFEPNVVSHLVNEHGTGWTTTWEADLTRSLNRVVSEEIDIEDHCRSVFRQIGSTIAYLKRASALYGRLTGKPIAAAGS